MNYRRVGDSGLKVSEIAIGAWLTYGGPVSHETTRRIILAAIECGVNFIDLADIYSGGRAEEAVGAAIRDLKRSDLVVSSKLFWPMSENINDRGLSRKHIMESIDKSLHRLGLDYLDIYFCHRFDPEVPMDEIVPAMEDLVRQGKILYWGTSVWPAEQIERACGVARDRRAYRPIVEQPRYNMLDRHIEEAILPTCARNGLGLTVWSPLAQGFLTGKYVDGMPAGSRGADTNWLKGDLTEENLVKVRQLAELAAQLDMTLAQMALAWILRRPEISCVITGATRPEQVKENVAAAEKRIPAEALKTIEKILNNRPVVLPG